MDQGKSRTNEKSDRIEDVAQHELQRKMVDAEPTTDPGEQTVDRGNERQKSENITEDLASNDEAEHRALGESM